ncbi:MAG TPA: SGNH/GDSL hydrolase family protein [Actinomycetota bacterium]|nr:SGNH/GDSL hydrolase family protein [Actinomycetota bacterium]
MIKKAIRLLAVLLVGFACLLGGEIYLAYTREYLPTAPALELGGLFGPRDGRPLRFTVLGDSTAAGLGAGSPEHAYATVLSKRLGERGWRVDLTAYGVSGARVHDVLVDQVPEAVATKPDLVFVGIGANDVSHLTRLSDVERDMGAAIDALKQTGAVVVVAGPPDMRAAAWLEPLRSLAGWRGRQVADAIAHVARERDVPVVPLAEKAAPYFASHPEDAYASDMFHPGVGGYRAWADAIFPVLLEALERRG